MKKIFTLFIIVSSTINLKAFEFKCEIAVPVELMMVYKYSGIKVGGPYGGIEAVITKLDNNRINYSVPKLSRPDETIFYDYLSDDTNIITYKRGSDQHYLNLKNAKLSILYPPGSYSGSNNKEPVLAGDQHCVMLGAEKLNETEEERKMRECEQTKGRSMFDDPKNLDRVAKKGKWTLQDMYDYSGVSCPQIRKWQKWKESQ